MSFSQRKVMPFDKNLFKLIAKDAYQELLYEHEINIKKEQKAFIDRQHIICKAAHSKF